MQPACCAFSRALAKTGKRIAARIAIIAITTSSSMSVNPADLPGRDKPCRAGKAGQGVEIPRCDMDVLPDLRGRAAVLRCGWHRDATGVNSTGRLESPSQRAFERCGPRYSGMPS